MIKLLQNMLRGSKERLSQRVLTFERPLVLLQSDDWGRAGIRDRAGWEKLQAAGFNLGANPYDFYSLETADDVRALAGVLGKHRDSTGRMASIVMNFIMANVEFGASLGPGWMQIPLRPLTQGLPSSWDRPELQDAYRRGVLAAVFYPALHGLTHFCERAMLRACNGTNDRAQLVRTLWSAQTAYIHWRMPWIGYEYWDPEMSRDCRFLTLPDQRAAIQRASEIFHQLFGSAPFSACAPGYRANPDTRAAWFENGVRVAQNGPGGQQSPYLDQRGMLYTFRTVEMEPALDPRCDLQKLLTEVGECFARGVPAVISIHSINFQSTIRDFRTPTLRLLDECLTSLERKWPDLLYLNDADLFSIATTGAYAVAGQSVKVGACIVATHD